MMVEPSSALPTPASTDLRIQNFWPIRRRRRKLALSRAHSAADDREIRLPAELKTSNSNWWLLAWTLRSGHVDNSLVCRVNARFGSFFSNMSGEEAARISRKHSCLRRGREEELVAIRSACV